MNPLARLAALHATGKLDTRTWSLIEQAYAAEMEARERRDDAGRDRARTYRQRRETKRLWASIGVFA